MDRDKLRQNESHRKNEDPTNKTNAGILEEFSVQRLAQHAEACRRMTHGVQ